MTDSPSKHVRADVTLTSERGDSATLHDLPVSVMQALYHEVTGKTETIKQNFSWDYTADDEDIIRLCERIVQCIEQYDFKAGDINFSIKHHDGETINCSSIEKFKQYDKSRTEPTSEIIVSIFFLISNPQYARYQNYRIDVTLSSYVLLKDTRNLRWGSPERSSAVFQIEYVDSYQSSKTGRRV